MIVVFLQLVTVAFQFFQLPACLFQRGLSLLGRRFGNLFKRTANSPAISVSMAGVNAISSSLSGEFSRAMASSICSNRTWIFFIRRSRFRSTVFLQTNVYLLAVDVFHVQADEASGREQKYNLGEHFVDLPLHPVAETVDSNEVRFLVSGQPNIMNAR